MAGTGTGPGRGIRRRPGGSAGRTTGTKTSGPPGTRRYLRGKVESLTRVDRSGDPDDLVDAAEAARMLRYSSRDVIHANRRLGYFPEPDAYGTAARGRPAPLWKRSTVWAAADRRPGMGGGHKPGTPGRPRQAAPVRG